MSRDEDALLDILERIDLINENGPKSESELTGNVTLQAATQHWLLIIGEAANRVSDELKQRHPEVPWREIVDFRNLVVHGYEHVLLAEVFRVIENDLPGLEARVRAIIDGLAE